MKSLVNSKFVITISTALPMSITLKKPKSEIILFGTLIVVASG